MECNINVIENLSSIKEQVCKCLVKAKENKFLTDKEYEVIEAKIKDDTLIIGVIGQMKAGKSTFLNAFLFRDKVLPAASTPMTASLSIITYGEKDEVEAEFYTEEDWENDIVKKANLGKINAETGEEPESDVKAAMELFENSKKLGGELGGLLRGKKKSSSLNELKEFVGADGKYTPITKSVTIKMADPRLKGIEVVDTPGFNDPVASREERTKEFLVRADVVILLLYAGQAFTEEDRKIAFDYLKSAGVGKVVFAVNKYDASIEKSDIESGNMENEIKKHVIDSISQELGKNKDSAILKKMFENPNPVLLSAQMALFYHLGMEKIKGDEDDLYHYDRLNELFEFKDRKDLLERSKIADLEGEINKILSKEKMELLYRKPIAVIQGKITEKMDLYGKKELILEEEKKNLSLSVKDLTAKQKELEKNQAAIEKTIEKNNLQLTDFLNDKISEAEKALLDCKKKYIGNMRNIVDTSRGDCSNRLRDAVREMAFEFTERLKTLAEQVRINFGRQSEDMLDKIKDFVEDYERIENRISQKLKAFKDISFDELFLRAEFTQPGNAGAGQFASLGQSASPKGGGGWAVGGGIVGAAVGSFLGPVGMWIGSGIGSLLGGLFGRSRSRASAERAAAEEQRAAEERRIEAIKKDFRAQIDSIPSGIEETKTIFQNVRKCAEDFIKFFKRNILEDVVTPMQENITNIINNAGDREKKLSKNTADLADLAKQKELAEKQLQEINGMIDKNLLA